MEIGHAQLAIMLHSVPHLGPRGIARLLKDVPSGDCRVHLEDLGFWNVSPDTLRKMYSLHPAAAECIVNQREQLLSASSEIATAVDRLGIKVITLNDSDYPTCIREYEHYPPPILYAYGNIGLLSDQKFAVISSSKIDSHGVEVMREIAGLLCDGGLAAVTSHNTEPYQVVGLTAKSRNAPICLILDRGILSAFPRGLGWEPVAQARIWGLRFDPDRDLVLSKFRVYDPWIGANGRERDRMVFALADIVVAVEVRTGGIMEAECLRALKYGREVYVYGPEDDHMPSGNRKLLESGGNRISRDWAPSLVATLDLPNGLIPDGFTTGEWE